MADSAAFTWSVTLRYGGYVAEDRPPLPRAQQLGRYHLLDRIAFGGMAEIYRAKTFDQRGRSHFVAIKRVLSHLLEDEEFLQMLVDEARIAGMLAHDNIARIFEFAHAGSEYFIAMEYVEGKDLRSILEKCRTGGRGVPPSHAAFIAAETAAALAAAHELKDDFGREMKVVHRDVSPSNVLCSYDGGVKLCDFGIAKAALSQVQTRAGIIKGKVKYMSPEQAMGRKLDGRSDLFALGTVLYEMLSLRPPFTGTSEMDILIKIRDVKYSPLAEILPAAPPALAAIVARSLSRSRSARFQSAREVRAALLGFLDGFHPGYGRDTLGRFVRRLFAEERKSDQKRLGEYTLTDGDNTLVGENLIADALGPGALYSQFTPISTAIERPQPGRSDRALPDEPTATAADARIVFDEFGPQVTLVDPPQDLHLQHTLILPAARAPGPDVHGTKTRILPAGAGSASLHEEPTRILSALGGQHGEKPVRDPKGEKKAKGAPKAKKR